MRVSNRLGSKCVIGPNPERPATTLAHNSSTVFPTGLTSPIPVTTTRARSATALLLSPLCL